MNKINIKYNFFVLLAAATFSMQSCEIDDAAKIDLVELGAPQKEFVVDADACSIEIPVYSNGDYHIEKIGEDTNWVTLNKMAGSGDETLVADCTFNEEFKRMCGFVLCSDVDERRDTLYVKQKGLIDAVLQLNNSSIVAAGAGGVTEVDVVTNVPYEYMDVLINYSDQSDTTWITSTNITTDPSGGNNCSLQVTTEANPQEVKPRTAAVTFSFTDGWGDKVSIMVNLVQRNAKEGLGAILTFKEIKDSYSTGKAIDDYVILEGVVVSRKESGNAGENEQVTSSAIDESGSVTTVYIQNMDASEGFCLRTVTEEDNIFSQFDKVQILIHGTVLTMYEQPERYVFSGITKAMVVSQVAGSKSDIPVKEKYMSELTDKDIYTYLSLKDCEIPIRKGSITPLNEGYTHATGAERISKYPLLIRDINGDAMYMYTNTVCPYRSDGTMLPYGSGKISGVLVHERFSRFEWKNGADPVDMEDDVTLGNIGDYQIRHQCKEDIWADMRSSVEDSFSALLTEYRYWNPDLQEEVMRPTYGTNGWLTHTYQEKYTGDPALDYTMSTYKQHLYGIGTYDYLGPIGNSTKYMFGDNWGNRNGIGVIIDPLKEFYNSSMSSFVAKNPDGSIEWCGANCTNTTVTNNTKKGAGGINNQNSSAAGKANVYGGCYTAFGSNFWWNDETQRPYGWLVNFSTKGISTTQLSMQIAVMNSQQTWYAPRFWKAEWAETDSQAEVDDDEWKLIGKYTVPDVSVWSNTLYSSIVAFKYINFELPLEMLGKENVYIRLVPENDICSDGADYANARLKDSKNGSALAAEHASGLSYFAIRYNK